VTEQDINATLQAVAVGAPAHTAPAAAGILLALPLAAGAVATFRRRD
jgi:hypothetical protein